MKSSFLAMAIVLSSTALADTVTWPMQDKGALALVKILKGKTLVCISSDKSEEEKGFYPVKISAKKLNATTANITIGTGKEGVRFGFGGDELTDVEVSPSWIHLSAGDDGRREFMIQYYKDFATDSNDCYNPYLGPTEQEYDGNIAGINSTIWDAGNIWSEGIQCCFGEVQDHRFQ